MRAMIRSTITAALTSHAVRDARRAIFGARRKITGARPTVHYFHQPDDPYRAPRTMTSLLLAIRPLWRDARFHC